MKMLRTCCCALALLCLAALTAAVHEEDDVTSSDVTTRPVNSGVVTSRVGGRWPAPDGRLAKWRGRPAAHKTHHNRRRRSSSPPPWPLLRVRGSVLVPAKPCPPQHKRDHKGVCRRVWG